jgi:hypothetical protein
MTPSPRRLRPAARAPPPAPRRPRPAASPAGSPPTRRNSPPPARPVWNTPLNAVPNPQTTAGYVRFFAALLTADHDGDLHKHTKRLDSWIRQARAAPDGARAAVLRRRPAHRPRRRRRGARPALRQWPHRRHRQQNQAAQTADGRQSSAATAPKTDTPGIKLPLLITTNYHGILAEPLTGHSRPSRGQVNHGRQAPAKE